MIDAASVASPRSYSPEVFAGGTEEREVLLDLLPRRWVTVARAERIMSGELYVCDTATTCCVGRNSSSRGPRMDVERYSSSCPVTSIGLPWRALFQVDWLTTRMSWLWMGGQTARIWVVDMCD